MRRWLVIVGVALVCWVGGYAVLSRDPDATAYRRLCGQSAQNALDGVGTARLAADDGLLTTYQTAMMNQAQELIGKARAGLTGVMPPDERSAQRRDALIPLLDDAGLTYEDLANALDADDRQAVDKAVSRLGQLEDQLRGYIDGNRQ